VENPKISLIIPAYNEAVCLSACLDSVAAQAEAPDEVIVIDNNSTDTTALVAKKYAFVRVVSEERQGIVYARNAGFQAASGDVLARVDADVVLPRTWVADVRAFYQNSDNANVCLTGGGQPDNLPCPRILGWLQSQIAFRFNRLLIGHYILFGSNMAIPRVAWRVVEAETCRRTDIHEDLDLSIHVHRAGYKITYRAGLLVTGRAARVTSQRNELLGNLLLWPATLRVHSLKTWIFGWVGAYALYVLSFPLWGLAKLVKNKMK
jgi:glycosyltransferase involved in cell wall biosynthesis